MTENVSSFSSDEYFKLRCKHLSDPEKTVILLIDEVYTAEKLEIDAKGQLVGMTDSNEPAKTVLVFMVKSLRAKFSEVVSLVPTRSLKADTLLEHFHKVILFLSSYLLVQAVSVDNHVVNRKLYLSLLKSFCVDPENVEKQSVIRHPYHASEFLFLLYDGTHCIKNFFNYFHVRRKFRSFNIESNVVEEASFKHLEKIYQLESAQSLRSAHKLSSATLYPTSISKVSAKHALGE